MTDLVWSADASVERSSSEIAAEANTTTQEGLLDGLSAHAREQGVSIEVVAERVGADVATIRSALSGSYEMSMTELRHVAIAMGAVIDYRVVSSHRWAQRDRVMDAFVSIANSRWTALADRQAGNLEYLLHER